MEVKEIIWIIIKINNFSYLSSVKIEIKILNSL